MRFLVILSCLLSTLFSHARAGDTLKVYFDFNSFELGEQSRKTLDDYLQGRDAALLGAELYGHCDSVGSHHYNDILSSNRSESVRRYLVSRGFPYSRITAIKGWGKRRPAMDNGSGQGRAMNRRVEVIFTTVEGGVTGLTNKLSDTTTTVGTHIRLSNINFEGGRSIFLEKSYPALKELLQALHQFPSLVIRIEGHICCQAGEEDGLDMGTGINNLSEARAKAVHDYLIENGIDEKRLSFRGYGHSSPLYPYPERSEEESTANRRVEIRILRK